MVLQVEDLGIKGDRGSDGVAEFDDNERIILVPNRHISLGGFRSVGQDNAVGFGAFVDATRDLEREGVSSFEGDFGSEFLQSDPFCRLRRFIESLLYLF